jgi:hypothetical protein
LPFLLRVPARQCTICYADVVAAEEQSQTGRASVTLSMLPRGETSARCLRPESGTPMPSRPFRLHKHHRTCLCQLVTLRRIFRSSHTHAFCLGFHWHAWLRSDKGTIHSYSSSRHTFFSEETLADSFCPWTTIRPSCHVPAAGTPALLSTQSAPDCAFVC